MPQGREPPGRASVGRVPSSGRDARSPEGYAILACAAVLWLGFQRFTGVRLEDALITARYAENLAAGRGYVFNAGERVLGTTSPLHTLLLAGLARLVGPAHLAGLAVAVGVACGLVAVYALHRALRAAGLGRAEAAGAAALFAASPDMLWSATGGLETPLVVALMVLGLDSAVRGRWMAAAIASGALVLARVDGVVWAALVLVAGAVTVRRRIVLPALLGVAVLVPWIVFAQIYFGSPIPNSVRAKMAIQAPQHVPFGHWLLDSLGFHFLTPDAPAVFAVYFTLVLIGAVAVLADPARRRLWPVVAFPPLFVGALAALHAPWFPWYTVPAAWCGIVLAVRGGAVLAEALRSLASARGWSARVVRAALAIGVLGIAAGLAWQDARTFREQRDSQENEDGTRRAIGEWLRDHTAPGAQVAMEAIGYQGTYAERRVLDLAGIVSPDVVRLRRGSAGPAETFARVLERYRPDAVVLRSEEVDSDLAVNEGPIFDRTYDRAAFLARYREAARFRAPHPALWGRFASLTIYTRR